MYIPSIRLAPRLLVLAAGFAMATYGALDWHYHDLSMAGFWLAMATGACTRCTC